MFVAPRGEVMAQTATAVAMFTCSFLVGLTIKTMNHACRVSRVALMCLKLCLKELTVGRVDVWTYKPP